MTVDHAEPTLADLTEARARECMAELAATPIRWDTRQVRAEIAAEIQTLLDAWLEVHTVSALVIKEGLTDG